MASMLLRRSSSGDILSGLCRRDGRVARIRRRTNRASRADAQVSFRKASIVAGHADDCITGDMSLSFVHEQRRRLEAVLD